MEAETNFDKPNPQFVWDTINAYKRTAVLRAAIDLDLFTLIAEGEHTAHELAESSDASLRGIRILSDHLVVSLTSSVRKSFSTSLRSLAQTHPSKGGRSSSQSTAARRMSSCAASRQMWCAVGIKRTLLCFN